jgi:hypothetical protein
VYTTTVYLTGSQYPVNEPVVSTTAFGIATVTLYEATLTVCVMLHPVASETDAVG